MRRLWFLGLMTPAILAAQVDVSLEVVGTGFNEPIEVVNAGDERLFVVEREGRIRILYTDGTKETTPFLDIVSSVFSGGGETGLLGLAFPSDYCTTGNFYVNYTEDSAGLKTRISRFQVDPNNENLALPGSEEVLLTFSQDFNNHNGGQIEFGPDGNLYIGSGDGGSGGDPNNRAQNKNSLLGKMLRIDVSNTPYSIPADNPFVGEENVKEEIWAYGLRNPWKFAFDDLTGELFIGDVGQDNREEISYAPAGGGAGLNYGWRCYEGLIPFNTNQCPPSDLLTMPIADYGHPSQGNGSRCSVTGGRVYRGVSFPALQGKYLFTDFCSGEYWTLSEEGGEWVTVLGGPLAGGIVAFGADAWGEMYAVRRSAGTVSRVLEASGSLLTEIYSPDFNTLQTNLDGDIYIWSVDGEIIEGANGSSITPEVNGTYDLSVISANGCEIVSQSFVFNTLGLAEAQKAPIVKVYPNPARDLIRLDTEVLEITNVISVNFYSLEGKLCNSQPIPNSNAGVVELSISDLSEGAYMLAVMSEVGEVVARARFVVVR